MKKGQHITSKFPLGVKHQITIKTPYPKKSPQCLPEGFFLPWWLSFCVSRLEGLEGRSVRSTERSEARKAATRSEA